MAFVIACIEWPRHLLNYCNIHSTVVAAVVAAADVR